MAFLKAIFFSFCFLVSVSFAAAWETTTYYFTSSSSGSQYLNGTLNFTLVNGTVQRVHSALFEVQTQFYLAETNANISMTVNGQSCNPGNYLFDTAARGFFMVDFDCKNRVSEPGVYPFLIKLASANAPDVIFSKTRISYAYSDGFIDSIFLNANQIYTYLTGWVTSTLQSIWGNTNSTLIIANSTLANTERILRIEGNETNYTPQFDRIEGKVDNLTEQFRYHIQSVTDGG